METNVKMGTYTHNNENHNFNFYTNISAAMKIKFVDSVVGLLVDENHYNSVIHDIIFDFFIIDVFTDISTVELKNSSTFLNDVEDFLNETNIIEIVKANTSSIVFDELSRAVNKSIQYLTGIHPNPVGESFANLISTLEKKVNEVDLKSMMDMVQKFATMTEDFTMENAINTFMESDFHKKNLIEIAESKRDS